MGGVKLHKAQSRKVGLGLIFVALMLTYVSGFAGSVLGGLMTAYLFVVMLTAISGFGFLVLSTFLHREKREKQTFGQELLGKEKLQYGVYTQGNWISVLDEKAKEKKKSDNTN